MYVCVFLSFCMIKRNFFLKITYEILEDLFKRYDVQLSIIIQIRDSHELERYMRYYNRSL